MGNLECYKKILTSVIFFVILITAVPKAYAG